MNQEQQEFLDRALTSIGFRLVAMHTEVVGQNQRLQWIGTAQLLVLGLILWRV